MALMCPSQFGGLLGASIASASWDDVVHSLEAAMADRSHVVILGCVVGLLVVLWANWRIARWLQRQFHRH